jgi:hypothetical protein
LTICVGDKWSTATLYKDELLIDVGYDSPQEVAAAKFADPTHLKAFKEHFGVKK